MNPAVQAASIAAWGDEAHVRDNRRMYAEKFHEVTPLVAHHLDCRIPDAGFYLWARTPIADTDFARELLRQKNVVVLPGSYLARVVANPGPDDEKITQLFERFLIRKPKHDELALAKDMIATDGRKGYEDLQWLLMNKLEFLFHY